MNVRSHSESMGLDAAKRSQCILARANIFGLLAYAFFDPTAEFAGQLLDGSYISALRDNVAVLPAARPAALQALKPLDAWQAGLTGSAAHDLLHALKVEYAYLFIGPGKAAVSPYATFYSPKAKDSAPQLVVSPVALAVEAAYHAAGVMLSSDLHEPPDHFATEAEFIYFLGKKEAEHWAEDDRRTAEIWQGMRHEFFKLHFERWGLQFCHQVEAESRHLFYQAAAHFAHALIQLEGSDFAAEGSAR